MTAKCATTTCQRPPIEGTPFCGDCGSELTFKPSGTAEDVLKLFEKGVKVSSIAVRLRMDRKDVRKILRAAGKHDTPGIVGRMKNDADRNYQTRGFWRRP